jgi:hypothetical protein
MVTLLAAGALLLGLMVGIPFGSSGTAPSVTVSTDSLSGSGPPG